MHPTLFVFFILFRYYFLGYQDILTFVHNEYDVDKHEVELALTYYKNAGSKELIALHESISKVFVMFGGTLDAESEDDDDEDDEVAVVTSHRYSI